MKTQKKKAFTLAEVLITLGVIGIVAAMTIPVLMQNHQKKVLDTKYKKAISVLANGFKLMMADEDVDDLSSTEYFKCGDEDGDDFDWDEMNLCHSNIIPKYFKVLNDTNDTAFKTKLANTEIYYSNGSFMYGDPGYSFQLTDGIIFGIPPCWEAEDIYQAGCEFDVFLNGFSGKHRPDKDFIWLGMYNDGTITVWEDETENEYYANDFLPSSGFKYKEKLENCNYWYLNRCED